MIKTIILDNNAIYIENYKNIDFFDSTNIHISCNKLTIQIVGENLQIDSYNKFRIKITGIIININYIKFE